MKTFKNYKVWETKEILDDINEYEEEAHINNENGEEWLYEAPAHICDDYEWIPLECCKDLIQKTKKERDIEIQQKMQEIIDSEKNRCGEANAVTCWVMLKKHLHPITANPISRAERLATHWQHGE